MMDMWNKSENGLRGSRVLTIQRPDSQRKCGPSSIKERFYLALRLHRQRPLSTPLPRRPNIREGLSCIAPTHYVLLTPPLSG
ncbi:hypothetical protein E2C01_011665 [Portunus trituberculatus]|uniref:Uncharacterized protein n=1 Tax=Portunus trituberculatus TaxID=210409 RepID=A0A5B7DBP7_PORTR|nr:hypothetical protein [Portunus trituberculatus]